jgi:hypothetical protein
VVVSTRLLEFIVPVPGYSSGGEPGKRARFGQ